MVPAYDADGNMTSKGTATYIYNSENLLTGTGGGVALAYDPMNRLSKVTGSGGVARTLLYDGDDLIAEYDAAGAMTRRYVHGGGVDEPLVEYAGAAVIASARRHLFADHQGSIVAVAKADGTTVINGYDPYGVPDSGNEGTFQYTGQIWLPELSLYHYKARMYDPRLGRFMQTDPVGYDDGANLYNYVGSDPVNYVDPLGLTEEIIITARRLQKDGIDDMFNRGMPMPNFLGGPAASVGSTEFGGGGNGADRNPPDCNSPGADQSNCTIVVTGTRPKASCGFFCEIKNFFFPPTFGGGGSFGGGGASGGWPDCGCFEAGTLVSTPRGFRRIEDIRVGDMVVSQNEQTSEIAPKRVTGLIRPAPKQLYALRLRDAGGEMEVFHATDDHPWKVEGSGWVETRDLKPGDDIDTASGADMMVLSLEQTGRVEQTYNLTVAEWHTFMVGEDRVIVHNADCPPVNQMNQAIQRMQAPRGIDRIDRGVPGFEQPHAHVNGGALNFDGTWKHQPKGPLSNAQRAWLGSHGWNINK